MQEEIAYTYNGVLIEPGYSELDSRAHVNVCSKLGELDLDLPVVSANMKTITGPKMAATMAAHNCLGILHRFCTIEDNVKMYNEAVELWKEMIFERRRPRMSGNRAEQLLKKWAPVLERDPSLTHNIQDSAALMKSLIVESKPQFMPCNIGVSIGVKDADKERFEKLYEVGARIFCIDVAHGHHKNVKNMLHWINNEILNWDRSARNSVTLIAGNVATGEGYGDLVAWGADVVKVGIGPSPVCRTRYNTGVGVPQLYALQKAYEVSCVLGRPPSIIADGGITHPGDIAKAMKYADAVMLGSMFSGTAETPGNVYRDKNNELYKTYGGSASGENKGENRFVEGVVTTVKFNGKVKYILREIKHGLQGAYSMVGAHNHTEFQQKCKFIRIDSGARNESKI